MHIFSFLHFLQLSSVRLERAANESTIESGLFCLISTVCVVIFPFAHN